MLSDLQVQMTPTMHPHGTTRRKFHLHDGPAMKYGSLWDTHLVRERIKRMWRRRKMNNLRKTSENTTELRNGRHLEERQACATDPSCGGHDEHQFRCTRASHASEIKGTANPRLMRRCS
ncbi:unnamed protein product, partial [Ectocarpus sp. 13 AM-2016]